MADDYDIAFQKEAARKVATPMAAATLLQLWCEGTINMEQARIEYYISIIDGLIARVESKARVKGWLDYDDPTEPDLVGSGEGEASDPVTVVNRTD